MNGKTEQNKGENAKEKETRREGAGRENETLLFIALKCTSFRACYGVG